MSDTQTTNTENAAPPLALLQEFETRFRQLKPEDKTQLSQAARRRLDRLVTAGSQVVVSSLTQRIGQI